MKRKHKILAGCALLGAIWGGYSLNHLHIFEAIQTQLETASQRVFHPQNAFCHAVKEQTIPLENQRVRLLSWNIHKGTDKGWQEDLARFSEEQDFVLLQEATPQQKLPAFSTALFVSSFAYKGESSGVKTFAHGLPQEYCHFSQAEPWIQIPKVASAVKFPLKNERSLLLINAHFINFEWQAESYQTQLDDISALIESHPSAVIFAGDFNTWNAERKKRVEAMMAKLGLKEVSFATDERVRFFGHTLDHIFVRGFNVVSSRTEKVNSSDHSPLWVELSLE